MAVKLEIETCADASPLRPSLLLRMATQSIAASPNWTGLLGRVLDGGYELDDCLGTAPDAASFNVRVLGDRFSKVVASVFAPNSVSAEQFALWKDALELHSPHLCSPIAVSNLEWNGAVFPYILLYKADENLAGAIKERSLTAEETRELLASLNAALSYLHDRGFIHAALSPQEILAIGTSILLSTTAIRRINTPVAQHVFTDTYKAPESDSENLTPAADLWCLGATAYEVLTRTKFKQEERDQSESLPVPFNSIVYRCTDSDPQTRCSLADIQSMLQGEQLHEFAKSEPAAQSLPETPTAAESIPLSLPAEVLTPAPPVPAPPPAVLVRPIVVSASAESRSSQSTRPRLAPPAKPVFRDEQPRTGLFSPQTPSESSRVKFWSYAALGVVLVACLLWITRPRSSKVHPTAKSNVASSTRELPAQTGSAPVPGAQSRMVGPASTAPASPAVSSNRPSPSINAAGTRSEVWRVVVYTFAKQEDAQRRVQAINTKHPGLNPEVISSTGKSPYLVTLGNASSRDEANRLRQKARASGLPHDAYIQNFKR